MEVVIENVLFRGSRPGYPSKIVESSVVDEWIKDAKNSNVETILCLLDDKQLEFYKQNLLKQ